MTWIHTCFECISPVVSLALIHLSRLAVCSNFGGRLVSKKQPNRGKEANTHLFRISSGFKSEFDRLFPTDFIC